MLHRVARVRQDAPCLKHTEKRPKLTGNYFRRSFCISVNLAFAELSPCFRKLGPAFAILQLKLLKPAFCSLQVNHGKPKWPSPDFQRRPCLNPSKLEALISCIVYTDFGQLCSKSDQRPFYGIIPIPIEGEGGGGQNQPVEFHCFLLGNPGIVIQPIEWNCKVTFLYKVHLSDFMLEA